MAAATAAAATAAAAAAAPAPTGAPPASAAAPPRQRGAEPTLTLSKIGSSAAANPSEKPPSQKLPSQQLFVEPLPPPPWAAERGGFSFVKVVLGERLAAERARSTGGVVSHGGGEAPRGTSAEATAAAGGAPPGGAPAGGAPAGVGVTSASRRAGAYLMSMLGMSSQSDSSCSQPAAPPPQPSLEGDAGGGSLDERPPLKARLTHALRQLALQPVSAADLEGLEEEERDAILGMKAPLTPRPP